MNIEAAWRYASLSRNSVKEDALRARGGRLWVTGGKTAIGLDSGER